MVYYQTKSSRSRATYQLYTFLVLLAASACSSGDDAKKGEEEIPGEEDRVENALIAVSEQDLGAEVREGELRVRIPISARIRAATGELRVSVKTVDGQKSLGETTVAYDLEANASETLSASLDLPGDVKEQPDFVRYNLFITNDDQESIRVTRSLLRLVQAYEVRLEGPAKLYKDKKANYRVRAQDPVNQKPLAGIDVELVVSKADAEVESFSGQTDDTGCAVFALELPEAGSFSVTARGLSQGTSASISDSFDVAEPGRKILLTTDKPMYQPGQMIHIRALALDNPKNTPVKQQPLLFEIKDGKGNKIFKKEVKTDDYGIASSGFKLANILNLGSFAISVTNGDYVSQKTVEVYRYALPKFDSEVVVDRTWYSPGDTVSGSLEARYFFGKPVAGGSVTIDGCTLDVGETCFDKFIGRTDEQGKLQFSVRLPGTLAGLPLENGNALAFLRATVVDAANQEVKKETTLVVAQSPIDLTMVPESTTVVPGIENRLHVFATDPLGAPYTDAAVKVTIGSSTELEATTDTYGHASLSWTPVSSSQQTFEVAVTTAEGLTASLPFNFSAQAGTEHVIVRTDKSVYEVGEVAKIEIITSKSTSTLYLDWLNQGQAVDMQTLSSANGKAALTKSLDTSLLGSNRVEAYVVDDQGNIVRDGRTIFVRNNTSLNVELNTDKSIYAPGEEAELTFSVLDEEGNPAVAALGVQIVDEAVFALIDARPGLLQTYFELEDMYAQPSYQIKGPRASITDLLFNQTASSDGDEAEAAQIRAAATFAAIGPSELSGIQKGSWPGVIQQSNQLLQQYYESEKKQLSSSVGLAVLSALKQVKAAGCEAYEYCERYQDDYQSAVLKLAKAQISAFDFWGNRYQIETSSYPARVNFQTKGPDELSDTDDDGSISVTISEIEMDFGGEDAGMAEEEMWNAAANGMDFRGEITLDGVGVAQAAAGSGGASAMADAGMVGPPEESAEGEDGPRVRKDFPETLYVNPALITDQNGAAVITVPMADSITEWRVSSLANSVDGKLGSGTSGITVFQDFFVDIDFPATLTRGDEIDFPIALYNYLQTEQTVTVELEADDWFTPLGQTSATVQMSANQVTGIRFPVRVDKVGTQRLTVTALGSGGSDAVQRVVRVEPDGKEIANANSGAMEAGEVEHTVQFPADSIDGSQQMFVNIYPAFLAQVVEGMDSILQEPTGCFEQTTSSTWPNVLVTDYMQQAGVITPEIQMKAESLISAGYQRLLTYEHTGGGYSWFGEPGEPNVSVTAFGLMEFVDMSEVATVDQDMVQRTADWLFGRQAADGSWQGEETEFFSFNSSTLRNTAFVVWSLASAGYTSSELSSAIDYIKTNLDGESSDPYTLALVANALIATVPNDAEISAVLSDLESAKKTDGDKVYWDSSDTQTNFYCSGNDASVTATALVAHAMLLAGGYSGSIQGAIQYLTASKDPSGNFGSTQATIWALRTLLLSAERGTEGALGNLSVSVDDILFESLELTEQSADLMITVDLTSLATDGTHHVKIVFVGEGKVSYNLVSSYHVPWQSAAQEPPGPLSVAVAYDKTSFSMDETITATVTVTNNTASVQNMVLVTLGIAPGFQVMTEDLDEYKSSGSLAKYELTGRQLTLYITEIARREELFVYRLKATMPVKASDGGAEVRPYYQPDQVSKTPEVILEARLN